jgi:phosphate starvation-inducible membrane PsiE
MKHAKSRIDRIGGGLVDGFQLAGLFVLGGTIAWAAVYEYIGMMRDGRAALDDILLLFIYLELGAMIGVYFKTDRLPVLFLLYVAITAMTRFLVVDIEQLAVENLLIITGAILLLTLSVLIVHIADSRFTTVSEPKVTEH